MFGLIVNKKNNNSWFSWNGMDTVFSCKSYESQDSSDYFEKEPQRDHIRDWFDLQWENGDTDFNPYRPL
jgi:hypothetical protein